MLWSDARSRPPPCSAYRDRACRREARSAAYGADSLPASRAALRTRRGTEGTTRASARTRGRYASRRHRCRGRGRCAGHSGLGNDGRSTSTARFFSASKDDDAGEAVAEDALEARGGDEARQREQSTQRPGRLHLWRLTHRRRPGATLRAGTRALGCDQRRHPAHQLTPTPTRIRVDPFLSRTWACGGAGCHSNWPRFGSPTPRNVLRSSRTVLSRATISMP